MLIYNNMGYFAVAVNNLMYYLQDLFIKAIDEVPATFNPQLPGIKISSFYEYFVISDIKLLTYVPSIIQKSNSLDKMPSLSIFF